MLSFRIHTLGCKVNQYDTQLIRETFARLGYRPARGTAPADACVINTCTVTHRTDADSLNMIRRFARENPGARILVTGCLAERDAHKIRAACPGALIVGNRDKEHLEEVLIQSGYGYELKGPSSAGITQFEGRTRAFLKIQDGCDNYCSYCKIPLVRGRSRSRLPLDIVSEARGLAAAGFKEIVLCGICLGAFGRDLKRPVTLARLLGMLSSIQGIKRIRLSSIEAKDVDAPLIRAIAAYPRICRHLHIPIQSGDDGILAAMHRRYRRADYLRLIRRLRRGIPGISITTDVLVGFPGETEQEFLNTLSLLRAILPLRVHAFPYSRREGTRAVSFTRPAADPRTVKERVHRLNDLARDCGQSCMRALLGTTARVLIEEKMQGRGGMYSGYTDTYIKVSVSSRKNLTNKLIPVELTTLLPDGMLGLPKAGT